MTLGKWWAEVTGPNTFDECNDKQPQSKWDIVWAVGKVDNENLKDCYANVHAETQAQLEGMSRYVYKSLLSDMTFIMGDAVWSNAENRKYIDQDYIGNEVMKAFNVSKNLPVDQGYIDKSDDYKTYRTFIEWFFRYLNTAKKRWNKSADNLLNIFASLTTRKNKNPQDRTNYQALISVWFSENELSLMSALYQHKHWDRFEKAFKQLENTKLKQFSSDVIAKITGKESNDIDKEIKKLTDEEFDGIVNALSTDDLQKKLLAIYDFITNFTKDTDKDVFIKGEFNVDNYFKWLNKIINTLKFIVEKHPDKMNTQVIKLRRVLRFLNELYKWSYPKFVPTKTDKDWKRIFLRGIWGDPDTFQNDVIRNEGSKNWA